MQEEVNGPPTPATPYTACYCEENVYLLGDALSRLLPSSDKIFAVVISNPTKSIAVWQQLASRFSALDDFLVVWDYHVILCLKMPDMEDVWVYDADTRVGSPCKWDRKLKMDLPGTKMGLKRETIGYILETFKSNRAAPTSDEPDEVPIPQSFRCIFRVVPVDDFIANFSSDRSHMLRLSPESGTEEYISPPPDYPPIVGSRAASSGKLNTLMDEWVDMTAETEGHGLVLSDYEFLKDTSWIERF